LDGLIAELLRGLGRKDAHRVLEHGSAAERNEKECVGKHREADERERRPDEKPNHPSFLAVLGTVAEISGGETAG
jgi:hypothetical protein